MKQKQPRTTSKKERRRQYEAPSVVTYTDEELLQVLGPAQTITYTRDPFA